MHVKLPNKAHSFLFINIKAISALRLKIVSEINIFQACAQAEKFLKHILG